LDAIQNFLIALVSAYFQDIKKERWALTDEGKLYAAAGSPEMQLFLAIPPEGISPAELQVSSCLLWVCFITFVFF